MILIKQQKYGKWKLICISQLKTESLLVLLPKNSSVDGFDIFQAEVKSLECMIKKSECNHLVSWSFQSRTSHTCQDSLLAVNLVHSLFVKNQNV